MAISEIIYLILIITAIVLIPLRIRARQKTKRQIEEFRVAFNKDLGELTKIIESRVVNKGRQQVSHPARGPETSVTQIILPHDDIRSVQRIYNEPKGISVKHLRELLISSTTIETELKITHVIVPDDLLNIIVREQIASRRREEAMGARIDQLERIISETTTVYGSPSRLNLRLHEIQS